MPTKTEKEAFTGHETTGHEWDGIREYDRPLPRWWLYIFIATIVYAIGYCVLYPAIPLVFTHTRGVLDYTNRDALIVSTRRRRRSRPSLSTASVPRLSKRSAPIPICSPSPRPAAKPLSPRIACRAIAAAAAAPKATPISPTMIGCGAARSRPSSRRLRTGYATRTPTHGNHRCRDS